MFKCNITIKAELTCTSSVSCISSLTPRVPSPRTPKMTREQDLKRQTKREQENDLKILKKTYSGACTFLLLPGTAFVNQKLLYKSIPNVHD